MPCDIVTLESLVSMGYLTERRRVKMKIERREWTMSDLEHEYLSWDDEEGIGIHERICEILSPVWGDGEWTQPPEIISGIHQFRGELR